MGSEPQREPTPIQDLPKEVQTMVTVWQSMAEAASNVAYAKRRIFMAYVAEGFTEAQALELVKVL